jgi:transposase
MHVLPLMRPYPEPCSVLVMDNHSVHYSDELQEMYKRKGVHLVYLPLYSADLNPIKPSFGQLKMWMRRNYKTADFLAVTLKALFSLLYARYFKARMLAGILRRVVMV